MIANVDPLEDRNEHIDLYHLFQSDPYTFSRSLNNPSSFSEL